MNNQEIEEITNPGRRFYEMAEQVFYQQEMDIVQYHKVTEIPNGLKTNDRNRAMIIQELDRERPYVVNRNQIGKEAIALHVIRGEIKICSEQ